MWSTRGTVTAVTLNDEMPCKGPWLSAHAIKSSFCSELFHASIPIESLQVMEESAVLGAAVMHVTSDLISNQILEIDSVATLLGMAGKGEQLCVVDPTVDPRDFFDATDFGTCSILNDPDKLSSVL